MAKDKLTSMWKSGATGWFGESSRHSLASKGVKTKIPMPHTISLGPSLPIPVREKKGIPMPHTLSLGPLPVPKYAKREIPALTLSGGKLSDFGGGKAVKEFRVWVHPKGGGDDYYYPFSREDFHNVSSFIHDLVKTNDAKNFVIEPPLAVVWDKKNKKYREVQIDGIKYAKPEIKGQQLRIRTMYPKKCTARYGTQDVGDKGKLQRVSCITKGNGWKTQSWRLNLSDYKNRNDALADLNKIKSLSTKKRLQAVKEINKWFG